jgi:HSP20 family protein
MMAITRWKPLSAELRPFWMDTTFPLPRWMEEMMGEGQTANLTVWGPNVDISESPEGYEIHAELPGVKPEDVKISLENDVLTLSGEKRQEVKEEKHGQLRTERVYGRFERSFSLPSTVQAERVRASFEEGVLKIELPKAETAKSRQITIEKR